MACVLKKIFIPCSGRRATSTPSPFLWSSLARCGVKTRSVSPKHAKGSVLFPLANTHVSQAPSRWEWKWMVVHGHLGPWGACWVTCSVLQEAAPEFLHFTQTRNPGTASFLLCFSGHLLLPSAFPQLRGRDWEFPWGSWLLPAPRTVALVTRQPCWVLFGFSLGQHRVFHGTLEQAPDGEGVLGSSRWGRGSEPRPGFKSCGRGVFPTYPMKYRSFWTGLKTECESEEITSCIYFDIGSCSDVS